MKAKIMELALSLLFSTSALYAASEHIIWEKEPLAIELPLNEERTIAFPGPITIVDSEELTDLAGALKVKDTLYLKAKTQFKNKQLVVQLMPEGEVFVLKLSADETFHNTSFINVLLPETKINEALLSQENNEAYEEEPTSVHTHINPVSLTRFAIQSLYAPARLLTPLEGVERTPMRTRKTIPLVYGSSVRAHPLISWAAEGLYVTAVELKNELNKRVVLDPRQVLGEWQTATFYPTNTLNPRGIHETTTVILVSSKPFGEALNAIEGYVR